MIGIFGAWNRERSAKQSLSHFAGQHTDNLDVRCFERDGASIGLASHQNSRCVSTNINEVGNCVVVMSGEIFEPEKIDPNARSGTALVSKLYENNSLNRLSDVNGQFACVLYDQVQHKVVLITDRLASVPIHYWTAPDGIVFATQIFTMLGDKRIVRRADQNAISQLFTLQRTIGTTTPVQAIASIPAATVFCVSSGGISHDTYWTLEWRSNSASKHETAERLADALKSAMHRQSDGDDVGLLLSGGLDSRLVLSACDRPPLCWTTASYEDNPELRISREVAQNCHATHRSLIVEPSNTLDVLDETVRHNSGLYPAGTPISVFMGEVAKESRIALTGHGLDYTLRGYYLPTRYLNSMGSSTRLPWIADLPSTPSAFDLFTRLRQGPPREVVSRIVRKKSLKGWFEGQVSLLDAWLSPWLNSDTPVNAWDAFILAQVSKHYAFTTMASVRAYTDLRITAFDKDVLDVYLSMPPAWRVDAKVTQLALRNLSPVLGRMKNANTNFRADTDGRIEIGLLLARAALRKAKFLRNTSLPSAAHSAGSWQNMTALYRDDARHVRRFKEIRDRLDYLSFGIMCPDGLSQCIDEHLSGTAKHTKLLRQLLSLDAWARVYEIE